jgi:hypothetical protein
MADTDYPFNDELLLAESDRVAAKRLYSKVYPALDHEELRKVFKQIDVEANAAKRRSRKWGFIAVALVTVALLSASAEYFYRGTGWLETAIGVASALSGVAGALIGLFGVLFAGTKQDWLEGRFQTERLRQFHFQSLIVLAPQIDKAVQTGDWTEFEDARSRYFEKFKIDVLARKATLLSGVVSDTEQDGWLMPVPAPIDAPLQDPGEFFAAYRHLRIQRQIDFTVYKLQARGRLPSPFPKDQAALLGGAALVCVLGLVLLHLGIAVGVVASTQDTWEPFAHTAAIWFAIAALAIRTLEEGMRPGLEVERYRAYQSGLRNICRRFESAPTTRVKMIIMTELETLTFDEMVNFLKANHEARFVM